MNNYLTLEELLIINNSHYFGENNFVNINGINYSFIKGYLKNMPKSYAHSSFTNLKESSAAYIIQEYKLGKKYIGGTGEIYTRIMAHKSQIRSKLHDNHKFTEILKESSLDDFELIVIFTLSEETAFNLEQLLVKRCKEDDSLLNSAMSENNLGFIPSSETRQLMSNFHKTDPRAIEQFKEVMEGKKRRVMVYGVEYESMSQANILSGLHKNALRKLIDAGDPNVYWLSDNTNSLEGIPLTDEHKKNLSNAKKNSIKSQQQLESIRHLLQKKILLNGVLYNSVMESSRITGIPEHTIHKQLKQTNGKEDDIYILNYVEWKPWKVSANDTIYENRQVAAKELRISISTLKGRIRSKTNTAYFYIKD